MSMTLNQLRSVSGYTGLLIGPIGDADVCDADLRHMAWLFAQCFPTAVEIFEFVLEVATENQKIDIAPRDLRLRPVQPFPLAPAKATHSNGSGGVAGAHRGSFVGLLRAVQHGMRRHVLLRSDPSSLCRLLCRPKPLA